MGGSGKKFEASWVVQVANYVSEALPGNSMLCGSVRRGISMVGDLDMVVECTMPEALAAVEFVCDEKDYSFDLKSKTVEDKSKTLKCEIDGMHVDMFRAREENWGAMTLFLTGNHLFNIAMRGRAKSMGYKLSQYGLFFYGEIIAGRTEEQIFAALGVKYMHPHERTMCRGERLPLV